MNLKKKKKVSPNSIPNKNNIFQQKKLANAKWEKVEEKRCKWNNHSNKKLPNYMKTLRGLLKILVSGFHGAGGFTLFFKVHIYFTYFLYSVTEKKK